MRHEPSKANSGFTVLEVLVALCILAVAGAGLISGMEQNLRQAAHLEEKTFATWVAENKLVELRVAQIWPELGVFSEAVGMVNRNWKVTAVVTTTDNFDIREVTVSTYKADTDSVAPIASITGYFGRQ